MDLYFTYIKGIDETNVFHFDSSDDRDKYMKQGNIQHIVTDSFYPPHAHLNLRIDSDDINFKEAVNYVCFEYGDKWYYYFIDSYRYINERLIEFVLHMDTITTYYFNLQRINGILERQTIKRWNGDEINRDYIREDITASDTYINTYKKIWNTDEVLVDLVFQATTDYPCVVATKEETFATPYIIFTSFKHKNGNRIQNIKVVKSSGTITTTDTKGIQIFNNAKTNSVLASVPISLLIGKNYTLLTDSEKVETLEIYENLQSASTFLLYSPSDPLRLATYNGYNASLINSFTASGNFEKNTDATKARSITYCPYLYDPTYTRVLYGEKDNLKIMQTQYFTDVTHRMYYSMDITTGIRLYYIDDIDNVYGEYSLSTSTRNLDIASDPWLQYISRNQSSLLTSTALNGIMLGENMFTGNGFGAFKNFTNMASTASKVIDKMRSPKSATSGSSIGQVFLTNAQLPVIYKESVQDISQCMDYFENYGMLVNKMVNTASLKSLYNRYYFDYLKFSDVSISVTSLMSEEIVRDITRRLKNGVRFWHYSSYANAGVYLYDNVEKSW